MPPTHLHGCSNGQEVNETDVLVFDNLDLINHPVTAEQVFEVFFIHLFGNVADENVSCRLMLKDGLCDSRWYVRGLTPSDSEFLTVQRKFLDRCIRMEGGSCRAIEEGNEDAVLLGEKTNGFNGTKANKVKELICRRLGWQVTDIDGATGSIPCSSSGSCSGGWAVVASHGVGVHRR